MAVDLARYVVSLEAQTAKYVQELDKANRKLDRFHKDQTRAVESIKRSFLSIGASLVAAFSVRSIVNFTANAIRAADAIGETARAAGFGAERFQRLQFVFSQNGVEATEFGAAMRTLNTRLGQFITTGAGPAAKALEELGLKQRVLRGELDTSEKLFDAVTGALGSVESSSERAAIAAALFGREAGAKLQAQLAVGIDAMNAAAEAATGIFNDETTAKADALADGYARLFGILTKYSAASVAATFSVSRLLGLDEASEGLRALEIQLADLGNQRDAILLTPQRDAARQASLAPVEKQIALLEKQIEYERLLQTPFVTPRAVPNASENLLADILPGNGESLELPVRLQMERIDQGDVQRALFGDGLSDILPGNGESLELPLALQLKQIDQSKVAALFTPLEEQGLAAAHTIGQGFQDAFADWITGTDRDFRDLLKRMAAEMITSALFKTISSFLGGQSGGAASFFSAFFGGARAEGGPVSAGKAYLVGERGPEFFMPGGSGVIAPAGGRGGVTVNVVNNINAGLPPQWRAELAAVGQITAGVVYDSVNKRNMGRR